MKIDWKLKLSSRKFWVTVAIFTTAVLTLFKVDAETSTQITALIVAGGNIAIYLLAEGLIDVAREKKEL